MNLTGKRWTYRILVYLLIGLLALFVAARRAHPSSELAWTRSVKACCSSDICLRQRHHSRVQAW